MLFGCTPQGESKQSQVWFVEDSANRGIAFRHISGARGEYLLPEIMGGGVGLVDVDNDGDLDAYLVQSGYWGRLEDSPSNQLYRNDGSGRFSLVKNSGAEDQGYGMGVAVGDVDMDGYMDLLVTNVGKNSLFLNDRTGRFVDITTRAGLHEEAFSASAAFSDFDGDGDQDLFVTNYVEWSKRTEIDCFDSGSGARNYCDPSNYRSPSFDHVYRNNGDGTFTNMSQDSGLHSIKGNGLGVVTADFNNDGLSDVFVANDKTPNHLWINLGDFRFENRAVAWGCAMDDHGIAKAGMGVLSVDLESDGDMDLIVVNIQGETDSYFRNEGGYFVDATSRVGLTASSRRYTRFGIALADFDNDGFLDLFQGNGRVTHSAESLVEDVFAEPNLLFLGGIDGSTFKSSTTVQITADPLIHTSRGVALGDIDLDGRMDLLVGNRDDAPYLLINASNTGNNWLQISLLRDDATYDTESRIYLEIGGETWHRSVQPSGSYLSSNSPVVHIGMGGETVARHVRVIWSLGTEEEFGDLSANQYVTLVQGQGTKPASL